MDKLSFVSLWDVYKGLFTPTRREITDMYFNYDLTVSEIAAEKNISRQAVSECIKGCEKQLEEYEGELHLFRRISEEAEAYEKNRERVFVWAEKYLSAHPESKDDIESLKNILKD